MLSFSIFYQSFALGSKNDAKLHQKCQSTNKGKQKSVLLRFLWHIITLTILVDVSFHPKNAFALCKLAKVRLSSFEPSLQFLRAFVDGMMSVRRFFLSFFFYL